MERRRVVSADPPNYESRLDLVAGWITPRLGGVGPMTRAMLFANAVAAAERSLGS